MDDTEAVQLFADIFFVACKDAHATLMRAIDLNPILDSAKCNTWFSPRLLRVASACREAADAFHVACTPYFKPVALPDCVPVCGVCGSWQCAHHWHGPLVILYRKNAPRGTRPLLDLPPVYPSWLPTPTHFR